MSGDKTVKLVVRLDSALHRSLTAEAQHAVGSLNGEIVYRLRSSFGNDGWQDWPASAERVMTDTEIKFHSLANLFPLMEGDEFDDLLVDIAVNGLHEPIVLFNDTIFDGQKRSRHAVSTSPAFCAARATTSSTCAPKGGGRFSSSAIGRRAATMCWRSTAAVPPFRRWRSPQPLRT
jgi:hypothetical protein